MLSHTHSVPNPDGTEDRVSRCTCGRCEAAWWVRAASEFQPSYCPYCGLKFEWYDDGDGNNYNLAGRPIGGE